MEEKYKITSLKDFIISENIIAEACAWIKNKENRKKGLFISGIVGSGKTIFSTLLSKENDFIPHIITSFDIKGGKTNNVSKTKKLALKVLKDDILSNRDVYSGRRKTLIIDDIDSIVGLDKGFITDIIRLIKDNAETTCSPIIITSATESSKKINELKRKCICINIPPPTNEQMTHHVKHIFLSEGLFFSPDDSCDILIRECNEDFRRIYHILDFLKSLGTSKGLVGYKEINLAIETYKKRNIDYGIFDLANKVLKDEMTYDELETWYDCEKSLLPLMIQENYINFSEDIEDCKNASEAISMGDSVDNFIYSNQVWDMFYAHGLFSTIIPVYNLPYDPKKYSKVPVVFTKVLTKSSSQALRSKDLKSIRNAFKAKGITIDSTHFTSTFTIILKNIQIMMDKNEINEIAEYMAEFGLSYIHLDAMNKLFVATKEKYDFSSIKKELKSVFEEQTKKQLEEEKKKYSIRSKEKWIPGINMILK